MPPCSGPADTTAIQEALQRVRVAGEKGRTAIQDAHNSVGQGIAFPAGGTTITVVPEQPMPVDPPSPPIDDGSLIHGTLIVTPDDLGSLVTVLLKPDGLPAFIVLQELFADLFPYVSRLGFGGNAAGQPTEIHLDNVRADFNVPLPPSLMLLGFGIVAVLGVARRRRSAERLAAGSAARR